MRKQNSSVKKTELIAYASEMVTEAMNDGIIEPLVMIECMQLAMNPVLLTAMRTLARLDEDLQRELISLAQQLSSQSSSVRSAEGTHTPVENGDCLHERSECLELPDTIV